MEQRVQNRRQNSEQERGRIAWEQVLSIKNASSNTLQKEYRSLARGLNAMIQINGLGQTLGFLNAKGKGDANKAHARLLQHVSDWMSGEDQQHRPHFSSTNGAVLREQGLLKWITDAETSSADYRRATTECLAFGIWLRRFAEAELEDDTNP
ncbi:MAG TPA: type III-B CRISPR module-associated protein Cmr5 [Ktedonosporobacter sp.]|jgi:CRISPR-associated protein Cmr5|nr:type III-B CRISPR module-associated protein Cmr5 [Ktedonosporobacter sp.]